MTDRPQRPSKLPRTCGLVVVGALTLLACTPQGAVREIPHPEVPQAVAPCVASVSASGELLIDGAGTGQQLGEGVTMVASWPQGDGTALVAAAHDYRRHLPAAPTGELWRVGCAAPWAVKVEVSRPGADFGNARLDPVVGLLYFTDSTGVGALNVTTGEVLAITTAPPVAADCWAYDAVTPIPLRDVVTDLVDGSTLVVHRGGPCGYEGDWVSRELHFTLLGLGIAPEPIWPHPVSAVAVSAASHVWLGDAGRCDEPGVIDPQTDGAVWRSDDDGNTWRRIPVRDATHRMQTAAAQIVVDAGRPASLLIRSGLCTTAAALRGGHLFRTDDDGATWRRLALPSGVSTSEGGPGVTAVSAPSGSLSQVTLWTGDGRTFTTSDDGATWTETAPTPAPAPTTTARTTRYGFETSSDGLMRRLLEVPELAPEHVAQPTRVFPPEP